MTRPEAIKPMSGLYDDHGPEAKPRPLVLVVDDDPVIGCVLAGALNRAGFDAEIHHNALQVLDSWDGREPDVAVVDWIMPDIDGLSLIDRLKASRAKLIIQAVVGFAHRVSGPPPAAFFRLI